MIQIKIRIISSKRRLMKTGMMLVFLFALNQLHGQSWSSELVWVNNSGQLEYAPDDKGGILPDFSAVGYHFGQEPIPNVPVLLTVEPLEGDNRSHLQQSINKIAQMPLDENGFRGALLLLKGEYQVKGSLSIPVSGIVIKGEGNNNKGTVIIESATYQTDLFYFRGSGSRVDDQNSKVAIAEDFVPVGRKYVVLEDASEFVEGDLVVIFRPGTDNWIHDLKMDQINEKDGLVQWTGNDYPLYFERVISKISGDTVYFRNPVVMEMDANYGGGYLMKCSFT
ncbi:MAG: hypothetical protein ACERKD_13270 [Prolixibacteraceae bacterium]